MIYEPKKAHKSLIPTKKQVKHNRVNSILDITLEGRQKRYIYVLNETNTPERRTSKRAIRLSSSHEYGPPMGAIDRGNLPTDSGGESLLTVVNMKSMGIWSSLPPWP